MCLCVGACVNVLCVYKRSITFYGIPHGCDCEGLCLCVGVCVNVLCVHNKKYNICNSTLRLWLCGVM